VNGTDDGADSTLIDTDIIIAAMRGDAEAIDYLDGVERRSSLATSAVTHMELVVGCRDRAELRVVERFLRRFRIVEITEESSALARDLLRRFNLSHGLLIADALIAASAITEGLPLASQNQRDFRFIPDLTLLPYPRPAST